VNKNGIKCWRAIKTWESSGKDVTMYPSAVKIIGHENHLIARNLIELVGEVL
jgi:hypothetical protein